MPTVEISVIVPAYNAANYLTETLNALNEQTFSAFEVIVVDDGSTDASSRLIDEYCLSHARFRALHTANGGEHNARLAGAAQARGKYIAFCDSDDLPMPEMLEKLYAQAERTGADVTICGFVREEMESARVLSREMLAFEERAYDFPELWEVLPLVNPAAWNKLYRAELLRHAIRYERPTAVAMDLMLFCSLLPFARRFAFVPEALYRYRVRPGSAVSGANEALIAQVRENMALTRGFMLEISDSPEMREYLDTLAFIHFGLSLVIRQVQSGERPGAVVRSARAWLGKQFPGYKRAGKSLAWNLRHHMLQSRVLFGRWIFRAHLMGPFLLIYHIVTQKLGREIKW